MPPKVDESVIPGRDVSVRLPPSFEGLLHSVDAVRRDLSNTTKDLRVMVERQVQYAERSAESMGQMRELMQESNQTLQATLDAVLEDRRRAEEERRRDEAPGPPASGPDERTGRPAGPPRGPAAPSGTLPGGGVVRSTEAMLREAAQESPSLTFEDLKQQAREHTRDASQQFQAARANPMRTMRQDLLTRVAGTMSDKSGSLAEGGLAARGLARGAQALGVTAEQGMAKGLLSTMPVRLAGGVGLAVGAVEGAGRFAEQQREQNRLYQQALGGENVEGFGQRAREQLFQMGQFGTMGGQNAERLFQDVTRMGMSGDRRGNALDFASDAYRRFGMSIQDSTSLIEVATRRGNESFSLLTSALEGVTDAARDSGVSAQAAQQDFARTYEQTSQVAGGAGGVAAAGALSTLKASMGPGMQDIDFSQMFSEDRLRMGAQRMGMNYGQLISSLNDPRGVMAYLDTSTQDLQQMLGGRLRGGERGFAGEVSGLFEEMGVDPEGNLASLDPEVWENIGNQLHESGALGEFGREPQLAIDLLRHQGILGANEENFDEMIAQLMSGVGPGDLVRQNLKKFGVRDADVSEQIRQEAEKQGVPMATGKGGMGEEGMVDPDDPDQVGTGGVSGRDLLKESIFGDKNMDNERDSLADDYISQYIRTGKRSEAIEQILGDPASSAGRRFRVITKDAEGKTVKRDVDLQQAVRYFSDQLASGEAVISSGEGAGQSVGDLYGFKDADTEGFGIARETEAEGMDLTKMGLSPEKAKEQRSAEAGRGGGTVLISPTPALQQWLDTIPIEGDIEVANARAGGYPPGSDTGNL